MGTNKRYYDRWAGKWVDGEPGLADWANGKRPRNAEATPPATPEVTPAPTWGADWYSPDSQPGEATEESGDE